MRIGSYIRGVVVATALCVAVCAAQQAVSTPPAANAPGSSPTAADAAGTKAAGSSNGLQTRHPHYRIAPGDSFDLNFDLSPEFNQTAVVVQPDGYVTLRGVGDLKVQGLTVPELTDKIHSAYAKILNDPVVSVILKDFEKPYFVADGQVGKPGKYDLRGTVTLTQAIAIAGGFTEASKHSQVVLFRRIDDQWTEARVFNLKKMEKSGNLKEDPMLHPGDMLFVPKNTMSKIDHFIPTASMGTYFPLP